MKILKFITVIFIYLLVSLINVFSQEQISKKTLKEVRYLINDSTGSYLIKETILIDGSKDYSFIPKSFPYDTNEVQTVLPDSVKDWFYKVKNKNGSYSYSQSNEKDSLSYLFKTTEQEEEVKDKKNKTAWWIIGSSTVAGGIIAYIFLKYRKGLDELPIQPDPPK